MTNMKKYGMFLSGCCLLLLVACSKSKKYSRRIDGHSWNVVEMTVNGVPDPARPVLKFKDCEIYKESCTGTWNGASGGHSHIAWQFRNQGREFELSNQSDHAHDLQDVKAVEQSIRYSGVYEVVSSKRKSLSVRSTQTQGFPSETVVIRLERAGD
jgi:hypothetical protein